MRIVILVVGCVLILIALQFFPPPDSPVMHRPMSIPQAPVEFEKPKPRPQLPTGKPVRVIRELKLPEHRDGDYIISSAKEWLAFLGPKNQRYIRWNKVDFSTQMVLTIYRTFPGNGSRLNVEQVVDTDKCRYVLIATHSFQIENPAVTQEAIGVVVPRTKIPVRFVFASELHRIE